MLMLMLMPVLMLMSQCNPSLSAGLGQDESDKTEMKEVSFVRVSNDMKKLELFWLMNIKKLQNLREHLVFYTSVRNVLIAWRVVLQLWEIVTLIFTVAEWFHYRIWNHVTVDRFLEHVRASDSSIRLLVRHSRVLWVLNMLFLQRENWGQQLDSLHIFPCNQLLINVFPNKSVLAQISS